MIISRIWHTFLSCVVFFVYGAAIHWKEKWSQKRWNSFVKQCHFVFPLIIMFQNKMVPGDPLKWHSFGPFLGQSSSTFESRPKIWVMDHDTFPWMEPYRPQFVQCHFVLFVKTDTILLKSIRELPFFTGRQVSVCWMGGPEFFGEVKGTTSFFMGQRGDKNFLWSKRGDQHFFSIFYSPLAQFSPRCKGWAENLFAYAKWGTRKNWWPSITNRCPLPGKKW